jgi:RNA polymerase sigma-70 factor (ECF subfamily)
MDQSLQARFSAMVTRHEKPLRNYAMKLTNDYDEANDLFQDTCLLGWRFLHHFQEGTNEVGWMSVIMRNQFKNGLRKKRVMPEMIPYEDVYFTARPLRENRDQALSDRMIGALNGLSLDSRLMFALATVEDYSYIELAKMFDLPRGTVASRLMKTRRDLHNSLN